MICFLGIWYDSEPAWAEGKSDEELVTLYQETNNPVIVALLIERYAGLLHISFGRFLTDDESAIDLAQGFYLLLINKLSKSDISINSFPGWLATTLKNWQITRTNRMKMKAIKEKEYISLEPTIAGSKVEKNIDVEAKLKEVKANLNQEEYVILYDKYYLCKSYEEIGKEKRYSVKKGAKYLFPGKAEAGERRSDVS